MSSRASAWILFALALQACGAVQSAARRDPMRCEQDPTCVRNRGRYIDCDEQCVDDPECVSRCKQMRPDPGVSGH